MPYGGIPSAPGPIPSAGPTGPGSNEIDRIRGYVTAFFPVYETRVTPNSVVFLVAADPTTLESSFDKLRREMWAKSYVPFLRYQAGEYSVEVYPKPPMGRAGIVWNVILLAATISTTVFAGSLVWLSYVGGASLTITDFAWGALEFAFPILGILGLHELAHFITAKRHHVDASLPFFLPVPPPILFGTFGAFISIREPIPDRKTLLDIGASGPIAGFVVAIPVTLFGLFLSAHSPVIPLNNCGVTVLGLNYSSLAYGLSLFWVALSQFVPISYANLSPVALAGWVGLFVTAINLLPAGTLDGGHVFRALFGDRARYVSWGAVLLLFALGFYTLYLGWLLFGLLIFLLGLRHPPPLNDISPLDAKRWAVGGLAVVILISLFVVVPIAEPTGQFALTNVQSANLTPPSGYAMAANVSADIANHDFVEHGYY
ncbi:MAG: site-2 protease family protein, partial [Thermoplasmata archaeon]